MKNYPKSLVDALRVIQQSDCKAENIFTYEVPNKNTLVTWDAPKGNYFLNGLNKSMCLKSSDQKIISVHFIASGGAKDSLFLWNLLEGVFKAETLGSAGITLSSLNDVLADYKQKFPAFTTKLEEINYFRIEEEREDCRLIVSVDPPTDTIRYTITKPVTSGIITPVQQYFEEEYTAYKFVKHEKIDGLNFMEKSLFLQYPEKVNNPQKFEIVFGLNHKTPPTNLFALNKKLITRSFNRQKKVIKMLLDVSTRYCEEDAMGKKRIDNSSEEGCVFQSLYLPYYDTHRIYTHSEFKMIVLSKPTKTERGTPLASIVVMYQPLYAGPVPEAGWALHELVYQANK